MMNYISQYDQKITKDKKKGKNIDSVNKWKVNHSVPILNLLKENYHVPLLHMSYKTIKLV